MDYVQDNHPNPFPFPMLPIGNIPTSIPLLCNICPKQPSFSDTSHLLTHIASKAHLSTYYKLKVRSATEQEARELIEDYDTWYATWGIEDLMAARMNNKESKRKQKAKRTASSVSTSKNDQSSVAFPDDHAHDINDDIDLTQASFVKHECNNAHEPRAFHFQQPHIVNPFATSPWLVSSRGYEDSEHPPKNWRDEGHDASHPPTHAGAHHEQAEAKKATCDQMAVVEELDNTKVPDYAKLKGILWPGMDMFDSATPEMKRKRNQKKPVDVVDRLEALSRDIEATEVVYSAEGVLQKARPITGFPHSSSSPMKGLSPPPKRQRQPETTRRKPLASKDANAPVRKATSKGKRARARKGKAPENANDITSTVNDDNHSNDHTTDFQAFPAMNTTTFDYLSWALPFQHGESEEDKLIGHFRPTVSWPSYPSRSTSESPRDSHSTSAQSSTVATEGSLLSAWDFVGQDGGVSLVNPLFMGSTPVEGAEDDEETISASPSER